MNDEPSTAPRKRSWPRRLLNRIEVDRAVFYAVTARGWQFLAAPITVVLIAKFFSMDVQGFYYTFWSLVALQTLFEFSLQQVIINFASHEWQNLALDERGEIQGHADAVSRLASLTRGAFVWYSIAALCFFLVVGPVGLLFFSSDGATSVVDWQAPWIALVAITALTFGTTPCLAVLEGCNQVKDVYKLIFIRTVVGNLAVWCCIPLGAELWTVAIASLVRLICEIGLIVVSYRRFFRTVLRKPTGPIVNWKQEVRVFQSQVGVKALVGYLNTQLINPVMFYCHGAAAAAPVGMTWNILTSLQAACGSWVRARAARFGILVSQKNYTELDRIFFRLTTIALTILATACTLFFVFDVLLYYFESRYSARLLPPLPTLLLVVAIVSGLISDSQWTYIHAHKQSPYLAIHVVGSLASGALIYALGRAYGAIGISIAYFAMTSLFFVPIWTWAWFRCRAKWHAETSTSEVSEKL